ncbi:two-component sensor histidine kinase [Aminobacter lissarensis]|uniref:histidine kinase n=1 Tax=Aminobacter carboxidus TaxID=376165 RepID=A0A8E1WJQ5_9HYPH|nr:HWE histidine kinase domain-containing protein [Aminobacter lissarensis]MBB6469228.1 two-component sensor histidine kinase [Aminobacter lissarensis]
MQDDRTNAINIAEDSDNGAHRRGPRDADFDRLASLAATLMTAPAALLTLADAHGRQIVQAHVGTSAAEALGLAERFLASDPAEARDRTFLLHAGAPIVASGRTVGALLVLDGGERPAPDLDKLEQLQDIAALAGSLVVLRDRSQAGARAEAALFHAETRRAIALEAAALASWVWDPRTGVVECDTLLPELFNMPSAATMRARDIVVAIDRRDIGKTRKIFQEALKGSDDYSGEYRIRGFDPPRWLAARGRVVERDADGRPTLVFGVNYDITERRSAEERQRLLLREINHRVKNTLATVQALATQTVRHAREPREFLDAFSQRLRALGLAHGLLSEYEWRGIGIRDLARLELSPFDDAESPRIAAIGPDALLSADQTLGLALILHELASNALKYGALSVPAGKVAVSWTVKGSAGDKQLELEWVESGGPKVSPPAHHGFGSILIRRSLAKVISSEVTHEFPAEGVRAHISMPLGETLEA